MEDCKVNIPRSQKRQRAAFDYLFREKLLQNLKAIALMNF